MIQRVKIKGGEIDVDYRIDISTGDYHTPTTEDLNILAVYIGGDTSNIFDMYETTENIYADIREEIIKQLD